MFLGFYGYIFLDLILLDIAFFNNNINKKPERWYLSLTDWSLYNE